MDLLRPPAHRGPLIASGAVLLTVGIALEEARLNEEQLSLGVHLVILAAAAALILGLALQARPEGGRPAAYQSVLAVAGLGLAYATLVRLADVLGADLGGSIPSGTGTWTTLVLGLLALAVSSRTRSAICGFIGALALGGSFLFAAHWLLGADSLATYRWLLLVLVAVYALASLLLRGSAPRQSELLVDAAGVAIAATGGAALFGAVFGAFLGTNSDLLPNFWELVLLAGGCGLLAVAAADRTPGTAYLGVLVLIEFVVAAAVSAGDTLKWWPVITLTLGIVAMAAGLRPRRPLPPMPDGTPASQLPLAVRSAAGDDPVIRVRREE